jgi:crotonobetainyl-CoA:carnitine CoA-transferase CaiB-like acyl-CoA transferase
MDKNPVNDMNELFKGIRVVELAGVLAGPSVGMFFAELGAEVIKIENKLTQGDVTRTWRLPQENPELLSAYFCSINYHKHYLWLDYNHTEDLNRLKDLLKTADIVLCNFKKGGAEKFGLDYPSLYKTNASIIYAQLNGFEDDEARVAFDVVVQAETGHMFMNGHPENPPTKLPLAFMDILAGHQLKEAVLTALWHRERTGKGSYLSTSLEATGIASLANQAANYLMAKQVPQRIGSLHPNIAPYGEVFETSDNKHIVLAIGSDLQFKKLCQLLNVPQLADDERFKTNALRVPNRQALYEELNRLITKVECTAFMQHALALQLPIGQVKNLKDVFETEAGKRMILTETINGQVTKRVRSVAFTIDQTV